MLTTTEVAQMIEDCENRESAMSAWEIAFIDSISRQERPLTEKQAATLESIWDRVTTARPGR